MSVLTRFLSQSHAAPGGTVAATPKPRGGYLAELWRVYECVGIPADASEEQRAAASLAFYAGAWGFYGVLARELAPGTDVNEADLGVMISLREEARAGIGVLAGALEGVRQAQANGKYKSERQTNMSEPQPVNYSNADHSGIWSTEQDAVQGINVHTNGVIDPYDQNGARYLDPRVRLDFFTRPEAVEVFARFKHDIGPDLAELVGELKEDDDYKMDPDERRRAYRFKVEGAIYAAGQEQGFSLGDLRSMSDGKNADGAVIYPDNVYQNGVGGPGKYTMEPIETAEGSTFKFGFVPALKAS